ncbi:glycosyltransferase family 2 protein [Devosia algicola]|uniref:Glycosyltransferase family 2 protein n=1 Tax=Devosia algicola TaxID=3026418 RepID=A0ABY7YLI3_9HYPH|nr:glycosyltransferase family 2 protein [Devosia algicola]WDR02156.1 glycosyltransferase family 2 protein [Devosia algicola]
MKSLPAYSVLIPLRDEAHMVPQLVAAMAALDYPAERLDIKFVVEADCHTTLEAVEPVLDQPQFSLVVVPEAVPLTKPKALDYALPLARGEYVVVFDAEDTPAPDQLWRAVRHFRDHPAVQCIQAELVIDNAAESWLTSLFAGEYSGLFGVQLPALARWGLPMPLGGTSNHFRVATLRELGGWDPYNVTEDADLGMRLARAGHRVDTLAIGTLEEAPTHLRSWLAQRTRWMKGWMQTFVVHNRRPHLLLRELGWRNFWAFELIVGSMIVAPLLHSAFATIVILSLVLGWSVLGGLDAPWHLAYACIFAFGYLVPLVQTCLGLARLGQYRLLARQALVACLLGPCVACHGACTIRTAGSSFLLGQDNPPCRPGPTRQHRAIVGDQQSVAPCPVQADRAVWPSSKILIWTFSALNRYTSVCNLPETLYDHRAVAVFLRHNRHDARLYLGQAALRHRGGGRLARGDCRWHR